MRVTPETSTGDDWDAPGVYEVAPGVHRAPLPLPNDGLRAVNVYIIAGDGGLVLVDSGWAIAQARAVLDEALAALDHSLRDVRRFLVTHVHRDHYTQAVHVRRELGTRVSLGVGDRPSLEVVMQAGRPPLAEQFDYLRLLGAPQLADELATIMESAHHDPVQAGWELPDDWLQGGEQVVTGSRRLDVVATPGHTRGHLVFHDRADRLLFAGDHVLPTITPSIGFEPVLSPNPLGEFLGSLALVRSRPDARLLPAHGPVTDSAHARVDELVAHHGRRLAETEAAVRRGAHTAMEAAAQLRWTRRERALGDLDPFNRMLAVTETAAHLELLTAQDRLRRADVDGRHHYAVA